MWVGLIVIAVAGVMFIIERIAPARTMPQVAGWWARLAGLNLFQFLTVGLAGIWADGWLAEYRPWSADGLGIFWGAALGYLAITFTDYWWHWIRHRNKWLWSLHQLHHSPTRVELATSFYKHPLEVFLSSILVAILLYLVVGLSVEAASWSLLTTSVIQMFYHMNIKTPCWLGYIIQRPESHAVHHATNVHDYNFSDLALWDMLFGTFCNPKKYPENCGFGTNELCFAEMLIGIDKSDNKRKQ